MSALATLRTELGHRRDEARARATARVARRTFRRRPGPVDRLALRLLARALGDERA